MRAALAADDLTPSDTLGRLAQDRTPTVRRLAGGNPSTPAEALSRLGRGDDVETLAAVAGNPGAPYDVQVEALRRLEMLPDEEDLLTEEMMRQVEEESRRLRGGG